MRMCRRAAATSLAIGMLLWASAARAQALGVSPGTGTAGTRVTLTGGYFGTVSGTVSIGSRPCKVVSWQRATVVCEVPAMPAGTYALTVRFGGSVPWFPSLSGSFTVHAPEVVPLQTRPMFLVPGESVTVKGAYFGDTAGFVWLQGGAGAVRLATVQTWANDAITFTVPSGLSGLCHLFVQNEVGICQESSWGTFVKKPDGMPAEGGDHTGPTARNNAGAAYFKQLLYVFYSLEDVNGNKIRYRLRTDDGKWDDKVYSVDVDGVTMESKAITTPVVAGDTLYLFFTGTGGMLDYVYLDNETQTWKGLYRVNEADSINVEARFAAAYNVAKNRIDVYYVKSNRAEIVFTALDLATGTWSARKQVDNPFGSTLLPGTSAVFCQTSDTTWVTYLAFSAYDAGKKANMAYVYHMQDETVLRTDTDNRWRPDSRTSAPFLLDLGEERMALLYSEQSNSGGLTKTWEIYHHFFSKASQSWVGVPGMAVAAEANDWDPSGAVDYLRAVDADSCTNLRWYMYGYVLWGEYVSLDHHWIFRGFTTEGWWTCVGVPTETAFQTYEQSSFATWPVLAVIDLPPFVVNGSTTDPTFPCAHEADCTRVQFKASSSTQTTLEGSLDLGIYFSKEAKKKSPLTFDFQLGAQLEMGTETTFKIENVNTLVRNTEGRVMALYLAPKISTYQMEWFNLDGGATGVYTHPMKMTGYGIVTRTFNPETGPCPTCEDVTLPYIESPSFYVHEGATDRERLNTYLAPPTKYESSTVSSSWNQSASAEVTWEAEKTNTRSAGGYFNFKIGATFAKAGGFGGGVEGSFNVKYTSKTSTGVSVTTFLLNPEPATAHDITRFDVSGYWLSPAEDGYWIPKHRLGLGDAPFFITYKVENVTPKE